MWSIVLAIPKQEIFIYSYRCVCEVRNKMNSYYDLSNDITFMIDHSPTWMSPNEVKEADLSNHVWVY